MHLERVIERSWPYWRSEFESGYAAFSAANIYRETGWLAAQIWKEWGGSGVYGPAGTDLDTIAASSSTEEELAHFHGLKALGPIMETPPGRYTPGPAAQALVAFRNRHWGDECLRHGVRMSEGGGLGLFHGAIAAIDARGAERAQDNAVRACLTTIIGDEIGHLGSAIIEFAGSQFAGDDEPLGIMTQCLAFKVDERHEQFAAQQANRADIPEEAVADYRARIEALLNAL